MNDEEKKFVLDLAYKTIELRFNGVSNVENSLSKIPSLLNEIKSCFVTLTIDGDLRGCIGNIEAFEPLYKNIINNAINAAFKDQRFLPLTKDEFKKVKIEVSILSSPTRLVYLNPDDLVSKLSYNQGVILTKGFRSATFLPQVWDIIPDKIDFLENLCAKAGIHVNAWREGVEIFTYEVLKIS